MPLWILLIPYALFLVVFAFFTLIDLANLWRFRSGFFLAAFLSIIYLGGAAAVLFLTYALLAPVDWAQTVGFSVKTTLF